MWTLDLNGTNKFCTVWRNDSDGRIWFGVIYLHLNRWYGKILDVDYNVVHQTTGFDVHAEAMTNLREFIESQNPPTPPCRIDMFYNEKSGICFGWNVGGKFKYYDMKNDCLTNYANSCWEKNEAVICEMVFKLKKRNNNLKIEFWSKD